MSALAPAAPDAEVIADPIATPSPVPVAEQPADAIGQDVMERKTLNFQVKALDDGADGNGTFQVYAAEFHTLDRANEKIAPGAFKNLDEFVRDGFMALGHEMKDMPLGTISRAVMDSVGLLVEGEFHSTPAAQQARTVMRERMQRNKSVKLSIGYVVLKDAKVTEGNKSYRLLKEIDVYEFSWVNIPANPAAVAVAIKGAPMTTTKDAPDPITPETKGQYLGDTDRSMACAALDRLHATLGYYLFSCIYGDAPKAEAIGNASGAIDEYKATALNLFESLLVGADSGDGAAQDTLYTMAHDAVARKYLARLASLDTSGGGSVSDLSWDDRSRELVSDLGEFAAESKKRREIRTKAGRVLSAATRQRIEDVLASIAPVVDDLKALLDETKSATKAATAGNPPPASDEAAPAAPAVTTVEPVPTQATEAEGTVRDEAPEETPPLIDATDLYAEFLLDSARLDGLSV